MTAAAARCFAFTLVVIPGFARPAPAATSRELLQQAGASLDAGRFDEALETYRQAEAAAVSPAGRAVAANGSGLTLLRRHRPAEAVVHLQRAVAADPAAKVAWNNLGAAELAMYECGGDRPALGRALDAFRKVAALDAAYAAANLELATGYDQQETIVATAAAARAGKSPPAPAANGDGKTYVAAGEAAERAGDPDLALANYARAEAVAAGGKGRAHAANLSGLVELRRHHPAQALEHLRRAVKADPTSRFAWNNLGAAARVAYSCGGDRARFHEAAAAFNRVGELAPDYRPENREWVKRELAVLEPKRPEAATTPAADTASTGFGRAAPEAAAAGTPQAASAPAPTETAARPAAAP